MSAATPQSATTGPSGQGSLYLRVAILVKDRHYGKRLPFQLKTFISIPPMSDGIYFCTIVKSPTFNKNGHVLQGCGGNAINRGCSLRADMEGALKHHLEITVKNPSIAGALCTNSQGLNLDCSAKLTSDPTDIPVVCLESDTGNIMIQKHDGITVAVHKMAS
uniref:Ragulator complex protein LAMTOR5 n=1 Tax=Podarcis muralis TaxID=64176 RepID=A0A670IYX2_PODMU